MFYKTAWKTKGKSWGEVSLTKGLPINSLFFCNAEYLNFMAAVTHLTCMYSHHKTQHGLCNFCNLGVMNTTASSIIYAIFNPLTMALNDRNATCKSLVVLNSEMQGVTLDVYYTCT